MNGQWLGTYAGSSTGTIILNCDELPSTFQGVAYLHDNDPEIPVLVVGFRTSDKGRNLAFRTDHILVIDPSTAQPRMWEEVMNQYPNAAHTRISSWADVHGSWDDQFLSLDWTTDIGLSGACSLPRTNADLPSDLVPREFDWQGYKNYVNSLEGRRHLFRGQNEPWRLRTSYHRTGRADLWRFLREDIQTLHRQLSARTRHVFNLEIPNENGAFFNLVQHHGYPTPLLDWTYSPYVAAFFAYRGISKETASRAKLTDKVRIHVLDQGSWQASYPQIPVLAHPHLHVSIQQFIAIENERMIPQQAASTVTNIDDIETYMRARESHGKTYLWAIDLPVRDRDMVVQELRYMGITAGSMFPGLDGACEELAELNFDI